MKKLSLKTKVLLSAGLITLVSGSTVGGMFAYAKNSDELNGTYSGFTKRELRNDFSQIRDEQNKLKPEIAILNPSKQRIVATVNETYDKFAFVTDPKTWYDFDQFFKIYYELFNESFILQVKYGSFSFYNEYVLAVKPKQFIEFTLWFFNNVSWGPDLLTLDSFRIVQGVEQNGNSITLGSHASLHKESSEIKFFPDAFFGSMPIYSTSQGQGNAVDALTYSLFDDKVSKANLDSFLKNIPAATALKNNSGKYFVKLNNPTNLIGQEFLVLPNEAKKETDFALTQQEKAEGHGTFVIPTNSTVDSLKTFIKNNFLDENEGNKYLEIFKNSSNANAQRKFQKAKVVNVQLNQVQTTMSIVFEFGDGTQHTYVMKSEDKDPFWFSAYETFKTILDANLKSFLDFYDYESYVQNSDKSKKKFWIFKNGNKQALYQTRTEALDKNKKAIKDSNLNNKIDEHVFEIELESFSVVDGVFKAQFNKNINIEFDAKNLTDDVLNAFDEFKAAIGYRGSIGPAALQYGPEDVTMVDAEGKQLKGLETRQYQVYVETYNGLINRVLRKYPHLKVKLNGPHIVKKLNKDYFYEYSIEEGDFYGLSDSDRIGIPLLLAASLDDFDGLPTDFLKYVGAHEYGHHFTLDSSQALNDNSKAVLVGGLSTNRGINESSYYSIDALRNYLNARTNLEVTRVNSLGNESEKGSFLKFTYIKNDGTKYVETKEDIWGSADNDRQNIANIINNPKRRFLQDFEGIQKAAKLRDVKLGDLFIANSFDEESGTLNPYIGGILKSFSGTKDNFQFEDVVIGKLLTSLKDGLGTNLAEKAVQINPNNPNEYSLNPVTFGQNEAGNTVVRAINMFDLNGNPVINVPLNTPLTQAELTYVQTRIATIRKSFQDLITRTVSESGWNTGNTIITADPKLNLVGFFNRVHSKTLLDKYLSRTNQAEINPDYNNIFAQNNTRNAFEYTAIDNSNNLVSQVFDLLNSSVPHLNQSQHNFSYYYLSQSNNVYAFVDKQSDNNYAIKASYTMPRTTWSDLHIESYIRHNNLINYLARQGTYINSQMQVAFHVNFSGIFTGMRNVNSQIKYNFLFLNDNNQLQDPELFFQYSKNKEYVDKNFKKIVLNNLKGRLTLTNGKSLYEAYPEGKFALITDAGKTNKSPAFTSLADLFEYISIDYSKAKLVDAATETYNWDIDYVKTKIDFDLFKAAAANEQGISENLNDEQLLANEIMERFIKSHHFGFVKDFNPAKELLNNSAIFSKRYGVTFDDPQFTRSFVLDKTVTPTKASSVKVFDVKDIQDMFVKYVQENFGISHPDKVEEIVNNLNTQDLWRLVGNSMWFDYLGITGENQEIYYSLFSDGNPSSDVINYNLTRVEPLINDKFTDYVYSLSETLTRDYVQTTYIPSWDDFGGLPSYVKGVNEAQTGLDYVIDATGLAFWKDRQNTQKSISDSVYALLNAEYLENKKYVTQKTFYQNLLDRKADYEKYKEYDDAVSNNGKLVNGQRVSFANEDEKKEYENLRNAQLAKLNSIDAQSSLKATLEQLRTLGRALPDAESFMSYGETRNSSYFGNLLSKNNGYFKDRFQKLTIGMELYDDLGNEVIDNTIRLKDFEGNAITSRPKAFFISQLLNYGVGSRNISGIFRHRGMDAVAMYGYIKNDLASKVKFVKFTDLETQEVKYLPINISKTNNIFYLQKQGDANSKVHLEDLGYTSWVSDYGIMGKYRDALLLPKHSYILEFVDEKYNFVANFSLGDLETISENGKTSSQAPIKITNQLDNNNQKTGKAVISIDYQFNITG